MLPAFVAADFAFRLVLSARDQGLELFRLLPSLARCLATIGLGLSLIGSIGYVALLR